MKCEPSTSSTRTSYEEEQEKEFPEYLLNVTTVSKPKRKKSPSTDTKILEKIELRNKITTRFVCCYSEDERLAIVTDTGLYILTLEYGMHRLNTFFTFKKKFCTHSDYVLANNYGVDINNFLYELPQRDMYEAVLRLDISANALPSCHKTTIRPILAKWSPAGLIRQNGCALASLTNVGTVEIFVNAFDDYQIETFYTFCNVTKKFAEVFKCDWKGIENMTNQEKFSRIKAHVEKVSCSAFVWSHLFTCDGKNSCLLFLGHLDGGISVWRFQNKVIHATDVEVNFVGYRRTKLKRLTSLCWGKTVSGGVLYMGDNEGRCSALIIEKIHNATVEFKNEVEFWKDDDFIQIDWIEFVCCDNANYLFLVKNNTLVVYLINKESAVIDLEIFECGNIHISGVQHYEDDKFIISTWTGVIYLLTTLINGNKLSLNVKNIAVNIPWTIYTCHGFFMSKNRVFFGFLTHPCRQKYLVRKNEFVTLFMVKNLHKNALNVLMSDSVKSLQNYWDCLELLRLQAAIEKEHPAKGLHKLNYDELPLVKSKVMMLLIRASEALFHRILRLDDFKTNLTYLQIRLIVEMKMTIARMKKLLKLYTTEKISKFQLQNLCVLTVYLKNMIVSDVVVSCRLGNKTIDEVYQILVQANRIEFPEMPRCEYCHDTVIGDRCFQEHYELRCGISKMPVDSRLFYKCPYCLSNACKEMEEEYSMILCPYCDVIMCRHDFRDKAIEKVHIEYGVSVECHEDCDKDILNVDDVTDDDSLSEVLWFVSSGDNSDEESDQVDVTADLAIGESAEKTEIFDESQSCSTVKEDVDNATDIKMEVSE